MRRWIPPGWRRASDQDDLRSGRQRTARWIGKGNAIKDKARQGLQGANRFTDKPTRRPKKGQHDVAPFSYVKNTMKRSDTNQIKYLIKYSVEASEATEPTPTTRYEYIHVSSEMPSLAFHGRERRSLWPLSEHRVARRRRQQETLQHQEDKGICSADHHMTGTSCAERHRDVLEAGRRSGPFVRRLHRNEIDHLFIQIGMRRYFFPLPFTLHAVNSPSSSLPDSPCPDARAAGRHSSPDPCACPPAGL